MQLTPLLNKLSIVTKEGRAERLNLNWAQQRFVAAFEERWNAGRPVRIINLKARQLGISTVTEAIGFILAMNIENMRGMVIGSDIDNAQHLLAMTDNYWETYPFKLLHDQKYASRNELSWSDMHSSIKVATSNNAKAGRGKTIRFLHGSEIAFWDDAKRTMTSVSQAVPTQPETFICLESTANGVGNYFYSQWQAAEEGGTDYLPLFFPWHLHYEYRASYIGLPYSSLGKLDSEEKTLRNIGLSDDALAWRRWAIRNLCAGDLNMFHQEYPVTPEEAFINTGTNIFPIAKLRECHEPKEGLKGRLAWEGNAPKFQPDPSGPLTIFRKPASDKEFGRYMIGGDPTHTTKGDYACGQVINRRTMEQVAVYREKIDPGTFGNRLDLLGRYYNDALIAPEFEGPGAATVATLIANNYPNIWENKYADTTRGKMSEHKGWRTTMKSKHFAIGMLLKMIVDGDITLHDRQTFEEMKNYVTLENGGYGNADGTDNDDTVMGMAIATAAHALEPILMAYGMDTEDAAMPWEDWQQMVEGA